MNDVLGKASFLSLKPCAPQIHTLRLQVPFKFKPGQSVQVHFSGEHKKHFYSISSSPTEGPFVEITVKSEPGSSLTKAILGLRQGDPLTIEGPFGGSLALPDPVRESLVFIAAGTGAAPFRSLIKFLIDGSSTVDLWLLHSVKGRSELLFHDEFTAWSRSKPLFHYVPTITRVVDDHWKHETGRINEALIRKHVTSHSCTYFLCGPASFEQDMETALVKTLGIPAGKILREKW